MKRIIEEEDNKLKEMHADEVVLKFLISWKLRISTETNMLQFLTDFWVFVTYRNWNTQ